MSSTISAGRAIHLQEKIVDSIRRAKRFLPGFVIKWLFRDLLEDTTIKSKLVNANADKH